jgi:hypothetical protein
MGRCDVTRLEAIERAVSGTGGIARFAGRARPSDSAAMARKTRLDFIPVTNLGMGESCINAQPEGVQALGELTEPERMVFAFIERPSVEARGTRVE